jgi:hypothetical protein
MASYGVLQAVRLDSPQQVNPVALLRIPTSYPAYQTTRLADYEQPVGITHAWSMSSLLFSHPQPTTSHTPLPLPFPVPFAPPISSNTFPTATLTPSSSSSTLAPMKLTLLPTYVGLPVRLARILATLVAKSMLDATVTRGVQRGSVGENF